MKPSVASVANCRPPADRPSPWAIRGNCRPSVARNLRHFVAWRSAPILALLTTCGQTQAYAAENCGFSRIPIFLISQQRGVVGTGGGEYGLQPYPLPPPTCQLPTLGVASSMTTRSPLARFARLGHEPDPANARRAARLAWQDHGLILINPEWLASWADRKQAELLAEKLFGKRKETK